MYRCGLSTKPVETLLKEAAGAQDRTIHTSSPEAPLLELPARHGSLTSRTKSVSSRTMRLGLKIMGGMAGIEGLGGHPPRRGFVKDVAAILDITCGVTQALADALHHSDRSLSKKYANVADTQNVR